MIGATLLALLATTTAGTPAGHLAAPVGRHIEVAFVLSEGAVMIDFAGPWEVFQDAMPAGGAAASQMPFELYTVAPSRAPLHTSGGNRKGMTVVPDFTFEDAPRPDVVVVGAQSGGAGLTAWLKKVHAEQALILSVCTGVFRVAETGLLKASQQLPTTWPTAPRINTLASRYAARSVIAGGSAHSDGRRSQFRNRRGAARGGAVFRTRDCAGDRRRYGVPGAGLEDQCRSGEQGEWPTCLPLAYRNQTTHWQGVFQPAYPQQQPRLTVVLNLAQAGDHYLATLDVPESQVFGQPVAVQVAAGKIDFQVDSDQGPLTFSGRRNGDVISGALVGGGKSTPLRLLRQPNSS
jgi:putative intracellular protease/amidase